MKNHIENQKGLTFIEMGVALAVIAGFALFFGPQLVGLFAKSKVELAHQEILTVIASSQQYRSINGDYDEITIKKLLDDGFYPGNYEGAKAGEEQNAYGKDITIVEANSDSDATLTYDFESVESCEQMEARVASISQLKGSANVCTGGTPAGSRLPMTIE